MRFDFKEPQQHVFKTLSHKENKTNNQKVPSENNVQQLLTETFLFCKVVFQLHCNIIKYVYIKNVWFSSPTDMSTTTKTKQNKTNQQHIYIYPRLFAHVPSDTKPFDRPNVLFRKINSSFDSKVISILILFFNYSSPIHISRFKHHSHHNLYHRGVNVDVDIYKNVRQHSLRVCCKF